MADGIYVLNNPYDNNGISNMSVGGNGLSSLLNKARNDFGGLNNINTSTFGWNIPTANLGLQGLNTLGGLYTGLGQLSLANKAYNFQKDYANRNYQNEVQTYNTNLEALSRARAAQENRSAQSAQDYYNQNKITR